MTVQAMKQGVLFDNDGTLVDTHDLILESMRYATQQVLGNAPSDEVLAANIGRPLAIQMAEFTDDPAAQEELLRVYRTYNEDRHDERIRAFPGIHDCLERLRSAGMKLGVVTSKMHRLAWHGLEILELAEYFDSCIGADDCSAFKPDPEPVRLGAQALGLDPSACALVGDSPFDMQAGLGAGATAIAVTWGTFPEAVLRAEDPAYVATTPEQVADYLLKGSATLK